MKKIALLIIALTTFSCTQAQKKEFSPKALSETLQKTDETQIKFEDILKTQKGKTVLIEVWASWCSDCVKAMPKLKELIAKNPNVSYVFISMDKTPEKWREAIEGYQLDGFNYMANDGMNGVFGKALDLDWIPRYIIVDKTGKIVLYRAIETDFEQINATLKQLQ